MKVAFKSHPIVQASSCITSRPAELLSDILEGALLSLPQQSECISTEDMLARVDAANQVIRDKATNICVASGDAVALYPSLRHKESARLCAELIRSCPATITNMDMQAAAVLVATHCSSTEIHKAGLGKVIPGRRHSRGQHPTPGTPELKTRRSTKDCSLDSKFSNVRQHLTDLETRNLAAKVIEIGVLTVIRNHVYRWKNQLWLQTTGVPTGLRLSGLIGRITMDHWRARMIDLLAEHRITSYLNEKYVDDCEVVVECLDHGARWDGKAIMFKVEDVDLDNKAGRALDDVTMGVWQAMASDIVPWTVLHD